MTGTPRLAAVAGIVALLSLAAQDLAADEQAFEAHTTAQLVNLCSTLQTDPTYAQSLQFCHGFAVGGALILPGDPAARRGPELLRIAREPVGSGGPLRGMGAGNPRYAGDNPANTSFGFLDANYACR